VCPGYQIPLIATASLASVEKLKTEGAGGGKVLWSSFTAETRGAPLTPEGVFAVNDDPREILGYPAHVTLRIGLRGAVAELDVPLRYNCAFDADFSGPSGNAGDSGADGYDGNQGGSGGQGWNGADGQQVQVSVSMVPGPAPGTSLLSVFVQSGHTQRLYYIDPARGGSLLLRANGGDGGDGGSTAGANGHPGPHRPCEAPSAPVHP
jgi:hypothetical protein